MIEDTQESRLDLRSEDVRDILSRPPGWMISWGNSVLILIVCLSFLMSYFIKYPDTIAGEAQISSLTPPVYVRLPVGRIDQVHVATGDLVQKGALLIEMTNDIESGNLQYLATFIDSLEKIQSGESKFWSFSNLGVPPLNDAQALVVECNNLIPLYLKLKYRESNDTKERDLLRKLDIATKLYAIGMEEAKIERLVVKNAKTKFEMQKKEYELGFDTKLNFLGAESAYHLALKTESTVSKNLIRLQDEIENNKVLLHNYRASLAKTSLENEQKLVSLLAQLRLVHYKWQNAHRVISPKTGKVQVINRLSEGQLSTGEEPQIAIIQDQNNYLVKGAVPIAGFGKIKIGEEVKLKVLDYPSDEYGVLDGQVTLTSSINNGDQYYLEIALNNDLTTSYGKTLEFKPDMRATLEVLTEDLRLIERLFYSLRSAFTD